MDKTPRLNESILKVFFSTLILVGFIFLGYEIIERELLRREFGYLLYYLHIFRGVGTSLIVAVFISWYFFQVYPRDATADIFFTESLQSAVQQHNKIRSRLIGWLIRLRWLVSALFILILILLGTFRSETL
ncbi:MAG: hypothetical protein ABEJ65_01715, partial [bacterium]